MREERNKAESVPARSEERRPRRSRSREAFRQRQKELAESRGQEKRAQENGGQEKRVQENKLQENRVQDTPGTGEDRTHGGQPGYDGQGTFNTQGKGPFDKFLSWKTAALVLILAVAVLAGVYVYKALGYRNTYFPHTVINGMDVSGKTVEEVKELIASGVNGYGLVLKLRDEEQEPAYTPPRPIAVDDQVELPGVKMAATVLAVNGDGTLLLQAGRMKMTVKAQQVRLLEGAPNKSKPAPSPSAATLNTVSRASSELDIRGYETLEAESVVENYLDSAVMAKLGTVTIIHGKGTGALRKAVHEILKRNKAVKSFRLGRYGEGEAGVTVVELK